MTNTEKGKLILLYQIDYQFLQSNVSNEMIIAEF